MKSEELHTNIRMALRRLAEELGGDVALWDTESRVQVALRQQARQGATPEQLLTAIRNAGQAFRQAGLVGTALDREVGPVHFRAALIDALRAGARRQAARAAAPEGLTVMECR